MISDELASLAAESIAVEGAVRNTTHVTHVGENGPRPSSDMFSTNEQFTILLVPARFKAPPSDAVFPLNVVLITRSCPAAL